MSRQFTVTAICLLTALLISMPLVSATAPAGERGSDTVAAEEPKSDSVMVDFAASKPSGVGEKKLMEVVATGVGTEPDEAKQNAFCNAIEQVVGVLVDAETLVKNDELVYDQVLTFSRGQAKEFTLLRQWQEDGLHYARIRAKVAVSTLGEKLKAQDIAIREVPGELLFRQAKFDLLNEEQAAEMFRKLLGECALGNLVSVEIDGKPEVIERDPVNVKLKLRLKLKPDLERWRPLHGELKRILEKVATHRDTLATVRSQEQARGDGNPWHDLMIEDMGRWTAFQQRAEEDDDRFVQLLTHHSPTWSVTYWEAFIVPGSIVDDGLAELRARTHDLVIVLADASGEELLRSEEELGATFGALNQKFVMATFVVRFMGEGPHQSWPGQWFAPLFIAGTWGGYPNYFPWYRVETTLDVPLEKLARIKNVQVSLVERERE